MKTKSFLLFSTSVFATSLFLIVFHSQQPQSIQNIVSQTHQHIKDFQQVPFSPQDNLRDVEENHLVTEERYFKILGLSGHVETWHNTTVPVIVTYARGDDHAMAVSFVRAAARLPYTVLLYNLGLKPNSLAVVSSYCNSSRCAVIDFDLDAFPSHVSDESITAFRPLIIQHALSRVGGVIFAESDQRWSGAVAALGALWARAARSGVLAYPRRAAVTSLTHPRMFHYLHAALDDFLFVQMLEPARLLLADSPAVREVMRPWVQCALTQDCIMPIGAQSGGCRFDKKPQYRYSGCHGQDASALSIILGLRSGFEEAEYAPRGAAPWRTEAAAAARDAPWRTEPAAAARAAPWRTEPAGAARAAPWRTEPAGAARAAPWRTEPAAAARAAPWRTEPAGAARAAPWRTEPAAAARAALRARAGNATDHARTDRSDRQVSLPQPH